MNRRSLLAALASLPVVALAGQGQPPGIPPALGTITNSRGLIITVRCERYRATRACVSRLVKAVNEHNAGSPIYVAMSEISHSQNFFPYFLKIKRDDVFAVGARELRLVLDVTDELHDLLAAVRAGDIDRVLVIKSELDRHNSIPLMAG